MKKILIYTLLVLAAASCGKSKLEEKKAELESLKKDLASVKDKISKTEDEISRLDTGKKEMKSKMVAVMEMAAHSFYHYIEVQAKIDGDEDVNVTPEMPGTVTDVLVHAGEKVSKGQILATLDDRALRQSASSLKVQLDMATTMFNKQKNLWDQHIGSEVQLIQAKTQQESLEKQYASLQEQLDMMRIKSPINGTVDDVSIKKGSSVMPGLQAFRVVNLTSLKVKGEVAESYISKVKTGSDVVLFFPDQNKEVKTKLSYSGQAVNSLNRTFNVEVKLTPGDGDFHPNQVVVLKIVDYTTPQTFVLPVGAIQKSSEGEYVFIAAGENGNTVARRKTVKSGMTYNGNAEITEGIAAGDRVITVGYQNIIEGDVIKL